MNLKYSKLIYQFLILKVKKHLTLMQINLKNLLIIKFKKQKKRKLNQKKKIESN